MITASILAAFFIGWIGGIAAYKYGLRNSPVILPPINKYDGLRNSTYIKEESQDENRIAELEHENSELRKNISDLWVACAKYLKGHRDKIS